MTTRIILTVLSEEKRPYMGVFDSLTTFYPRCYENGSLHESEHEFLIALAMQSKTAWLPADSSRDPQIDIPFWIIEAVWAQLEPRPGSYHKFTFSPPLEVHHAAAKEIPEHGLAYI